MAADIYVVGRVDDNSGAAVLTNVQRAEVTVSLFNFARTFTRRKSGKNKIGMDVSMLSHFSKRKKKAKEKHATKKGNNAKKNEETNKTKKRDYWSTEDPSARSSEMKK